jgi:phosphatidate cytidylyltransferase
VASSHINRWLTALIAVPALFSLIYFGSKEMFDALILIVILIGMHEYQTMVFGGEHALEKIEGIVFSVLIAFSFYEGNAVSTVAILSFSFLVSFFVYTVRIKDQAFDIFPVMKLVFGVLYIPLLMSHFILIRSHPHGVLWIFFILFLAFSGDVAAFYVGRTWGKRKLLPAVSPAKTVEGIVGLVFGSLVGCVAFQHFFFPQLPVYHAAAMGVFGSVLGQLGDLCESAIKRSSGVKDSGSILPGHGGIMDRLDCLLFIGPFVYYYQLFIIR